MLVCFTFSDLPSASRANSFSSLPVYAAWTAQESEFEQYAIHIRRGVADLQPFCPAQDSPSMLLSPPDTYLSLKMDSMVLREIMTQKRSAAAAIATGALSLEVLKTHLYE